MITLSGVSVSHGTRALFTGVDLVVASGGRTALVGPNGAGKTTLLEVIAGERIPDAGTVSQVSGVRVGLLPQEVAETGGRPVLEEVLAASPVAQIEHRLREIEQEIAGTSDAADQERLVSEYGHQQSRFEQLGGYAVEAEARRILAGLGFSDAEVEGDVGELSGGWMMRVALARLLLTHPEVLLLDEPTNHLDLDAVAWLEEFLSAYDGAVVLVSHDRDLCNALAERVVEIVNGRVTLYTGNYDDYVAQRELRVLQLEAAKKNQDRRVAEIERFIERFRYKKDLASRVQSRVKMLAKMERIELPRSQRTLRFRFPEPPRAGRDVVALRDVAKAFDDTVVYDGLDLVVERGTKAALVGPNGAGKSTLLKVLAGAEGIDRGDRVLGHNVTVGYFAQHQVEALDLDATVLQELTRAVDTRRVDPRRLLGAFLFSGDDVDKRVRVLSGGEKSRLALAKLLAQPHNLLCLDEPTNHLDMESRDVVEEALAEYPGTVVLVSHDRHLLREITDTVVEVGGGTAVLRLGGYGEYLARGDGGAGRPGAFRRGQADQASGDDRAERKRREAERRNRLHRATRELKAEFDAVEERLHAAEAELAGLTARLADEATYDDPDLVRELSLQHGIVEDRVAGLLEEGRGSGARSRRRHGPLRSKPPCRDREALRRYVA
ncbi:MAG: ABC-F family ATP-binding cassette domain-containing protein [Nitriliruptorales bacterium]